jgi:toxin ParE1/3/4
MKVLWTEQALARLAEIEEFIAAQNPTAAIALIARLVNRGESLGKLWRRGRRLAELPHSTLRELVEGNYRIVYRHRRAAIEIVTAFEAHRLVPFGDVEK